MACLAACRGKVLTDTRSPQGPHESGGNVSFEDDADVSAAAEELSSALERLPPDVVCKAIVSLASRNPKVFQKLSESELKFSKITEIENSARRNSKNSSITRSRTEALHDSLHDDLEQVQIQMADDNDPSNGVNGDCNGANGYQNGSPFSNGSDPDDGKVGGRRDTLPQNEMSSILQFSTALYYVKEGEEKEIAIDVIRLGDASTECSCIFQTSDGSAKAGARYVARIGELAFLAGETMKSIKILIIEDANWDATLEFAVTLSQPKNAILGKYLYTCRVKVIDDDAFPTNRFGDLVKAQKFEAINMFQLLKEYFKMNFTNHIVKKGSIKVAVYCHITNFYLVWKLLLTKALVDKILGKKKGSCKFGTKILYVFECPEEDDFEGKEHLLFLFAILLIAPFLLVHFHDFRKVHWKVGGASRKTLQANLLRKYLNYDQKSRDSVKTSDLTMAMSHDSFELVSNGYMQLFPLIANLGRLLCVCALQVWMGLSAPVVTVANLLTPVFVVILFPLPLFAFLAARNQKTQDVRRQESLSKNALLDHVNHVIQNYQLISDYQRRSAEVDHYEKKIGAYNGAATKAAAVGCNNKYAAPWLATSLSGFWFVVGGSQVIRGGISLGQFLTTMSIFGEVGKAWITIYNIILTLQDSLDSLQHIVYFMNLPTDLEKRMRMNRRRRFLGEQARKLARKQSSSEEVDDGGNAAVAADKVPIKMERVSYHYDSKLWGTNELGKEGKENQSFTKPGLGTLINCTFQFNQGNFIALVGVPGQGKSTLLKLLGGVLLPDETTPPGDLLVPPHLRVLHVSSEASFFKGTLIQNLCYGLKKSDPDANPNRVQGICHQLGISRSLLEFLDPSSEKFDIVASWTDVLSLTQRVLLHIARALIANPEILVIHKPTLVFDDNQAQTLFRSLRTFVSEKGLQMDPTTKKLRRPRTCVITTSRVAGVQMADKVFLVSRSGVFEKTKESVSKELLG